MAQQEEQWGFVSSCSAGMNQDRMNHDVIVGWGSSLSGPCYWPSSRPHRV